MPVWFGLVFPAPSVGVFSRLPLFSFGFLFFFFFLFLSPPFFFFSFVFLRGGMDWFSFPPTPPLHLLPASPRATGLWFLSRFRAVGFLFLGLSCFVDASPAHCDLPASVPVSTAVQQGPGGPTAGMPGQKVTAGLRGTRGCGRTAGAGAPGRCVWTEPLCPPPRPRCPRWQGAKRVRPRPRPPRVQGSAQFSSVQRRVWVRGRSSVGAVTALPSRDAAGQAPKGAVTAGVRPAGPTARSSHPKT